MSATSTLGIPWALYLGDSEGPDLSRPITGPVSLAGWDYFLVWLVADIPPEMAGLDTTRLTVVVSGQDPAWDVAVLQVGGWTPPPAGTGWTGWVPVVSHAPGAQGSQWRADVGLRNPGPSSIDAELRLHASGATRTLPVSVPAGGQVVVRDVVGGMGYSGAGSLEVWAPGRLEITSRSYNERSAGDDCSPGGTLGQSLDGLQVSQGLAAGQAAWIPQLQEDSAFRTNIGLVNTGSTEATVLVKLYDESGVEVGSFTVALAPGQWYQDNRPFANRAGLADLAAGSARVEVLSGSGVVAYGSVVDNVTNDPTTMPMVPEDLAGKTESWIPVAVHAPGVNASQWRTTLGLLNPGTAPATATVRLYAGGSPLSATSTVPAGGQLVLDDIAGMLGVDGGGGPLQVTSNVPLVVTSRTFTRLAADAPCFPGGTLGQALTATVPTPVLAAGDLATVPHLVENTAFRSNLGFANTGTSRATVRVRLFDGTGSQLTTFDLELAPQQWLQENRPFFHRAGQSGLDAAWASVEILSGDGLLAYGSVVDNVTNDPTTVVARRR